MSRKWQRVQRWDAEHLGTPALRPVRWVLHAFSSISLAVVLLLGVVLYGILASVPIGLLALAPTWGVIALTALAAVAAGAIAPAVPARLLLRGRPGLRFSATLLLGLAGGVAGAALWHRLAWPELRYDPATGEGLRFFAGFVEANAATTLRRLPGLEMSELEFYSWWPLRLVLVLFVVNMIVATVRRIEFTFKHIGVLAVHSGIVIIALGSVYYQGLKKEGDTILLAGRPPAGGVPGTGPAQDGFYDNTAVALWVSQRTDFIGRPDWEQRLLRGLPRYNDYGVPWVERAFSMDVPEGGGRVVDPDIDLEIIGYAHYAEPHQTWQPLTAEQARDLPAGTTLRPLREVVVRSRLPDPSDPDAGPRERGEPVITFSLHPTVPSHRLSFNSVMAIEATRGMAAQRFEDLATPLPPGTRHGLIVEIPAEHSQTGAASRVVIPAAQGEEYVIGETGWTVGVKEFADQPPFPIITEGYEDATSSVAIVRITPPATADAPGGGEPFDRWVYHRFPEITQDLLDAVTADGRPSRRDADPSVRVAYIDATRMQVYVDEHEPGRFRAIVRRPDASARVYEDLALGDTIRDAVPMIDLELAAAYPHTRQVEEPLPVPEGERDAQLVGTHGAAMVGVRLSVAGLRGPRGDEWSRELWIPFSKYMDYGLGQPREVSLPDGRTVSLAFSRLRHRFPGFSLQLADFEMLSYDHRGAPRDYQSRIVVTPAIDMAPPFEFSAYERVAKLNAPLRAPFVWQEERSAIANAALRVSSGLNPSQYKISQAGWDQSGWQRTQQLADRGLLPRPYAQFTILQVGNNPGIHIIAFGGVLMSLGIPWAFYVKPWLLRREKRRLAEAAGRRPGGQHAGRPAPNQDTPQQRQTETIPA